MISKHLFEEEDGPVSPRFTPALLDVPEAVTSEQTNKQNHMLISRDCVLALFDVIFIEFTCFTMATLKKGFHHLTPRNWDVRLEACSNIEIFIDRHQKFEY